MLNIDTEKMLIEMTRGDTVSIVFSAVDGEGTAWNPTQTTDMLRFAVAKKVGAEPLFEITNTYDGVDTDAFWTITIPSANTKELKFGDYVYDVQLITTSGIDTIIGKTDTISPTLRLWGEVATETIEE